MKINQLFSKITTALTPRPKKRLQATARAARPAMNDYDEEEPTTKLSSAFIVVLILHIVAVGGIYAFNSIKASRKDRETPPPPVVEQTAPAANKVTAQNVPPPSAPPAAHPTAPAAHVTEAAPAPAPIASPSAAGHQYQVKGGDNLTKIAFAYSVTAAAIMEANHLKEGAVLKPGQMLTIPAAKTSNKTATDAHKPDASPKQTDVAPTTTTPGYYTVKKGDTPTSIARNFGLSTEDLLKANKAIDPKKLQPGQTLKVPPRKS